MRFSRADQNQKNIATALRAIGATVVALHGVGRGVPDLLVGFRGTTILLEVKRPERRGGKENKGGTLKRQQLWRDRWRGGLVAVVGSVDEALTAVIHLRSPEAQAAK